MLLKTSYLAVFLLSSFFTPVYSSDQIDFAKFKNDKEVKTRKFSKREESRALRVYSEAHQEYLALILERSLALALKGNSCEYGLVKNFKRELEQNSWEIDEDALKYYLIVLRANHQIDDLLYGLLYTVVKYQDDFLENMTRLDEPERTYTHYSRRGRRRTKKNTDSHALVRQNNIQTLYGELNLNCLFSSYRNLIGNIRSQDEIKERELNILNAEAYFRGLIDLPTFYHLNRITDHILDTKYEYISFERYVHNTLNAKNKLQPVTRVNEVVDIDLEYRFSNEKIRRFSSLTQRGELYRKYNS